MKCWRCCKITRSPTWSMFARSRRRGSSRNGTNLRSSTRCLPISNIGWIPKLGGRRHTPKGVSSVNAAWQVKAFRDYADYMDSDEFKEGLNELLELAEHGRPAIMCSEAVPWRCHRRLITNALIVAGAEVADIMSTRT